MRTYVCMLYACVSICTYAYILPDTPNKTTNTQNTINKTYVDTYIHTYIIITINHHARAFLKTYIHANIYAYI